jgi:flagellar basal body-associated protein FliL
MSFNLSDSKDAKSSKGKIIQIGAVVFVVVAIAIFIFSSVDFSKKTTTGELDISKENTQQELSTQTIEEDQVVATVNGEEILGAEVLDALNSLAMQGVQMSESEALQEVVSMKLLINSAKEEGYSVSNGEIEDLLVAQLEAQGMSLEDFKEQLEAQGQSYDDLLEQNKESVLANKYIKDVLEGIEDPSEQQAVMTSLIEELIKNADIEYLI